MDMKLSYYKNLRKKICNFYGKEESIGIYIRPSDFDLLFVNIGFDQSKIDQKVLDVENKFLKTIDQTYFFRKEIKLHYSDFHKRHLYDGILQVYRAPVNENNFDLDFTVFDDVKIKFYFNEVYKVRSLKQILPIFIGDKNVDRLNLDPFFYRNSGLYLKGLDFNSENEDDTILNIEINKRYLLKNERKD